MKNKREESKNKVLCEFCLMPTEKRFCWEISIKGPSSKEIKSVSDDHEKMCKYYSCHACYLQALPSCTEYCLKLEEKRNAPK